MLEELKLKSREDTGQELTVGKSCMLVSGEALAAALMVYVVVGE